MCTYHYTVHFVLFCRYNRLVPICTVLFCIINIFQKIVKKNFLLVRTTEVVIFSFFIFRFCGEF